VIVDLGEDAQPSGVDFCSVFIAGGGVYRALSGVEG